MHTLRPSTQRHAQVGAWLLVLAILLSAAWGQTHRVLHAGVPTWAQATLSTAGGDPAPAPSAVAGLADEDGSSLCKLLDQLALGAGAVTASAPAWPSPPPALQAAAAAMPVWTAAAHHFDARGPPAAT